MFPIPVAHALRKVGADLRDARRRRRIPVAILAERASISRTTLSRIEKGDAGVVTWERMAHILHLWLLASSPSNVEQRLDVIFRES